MALKWEYHSVAKRWEVWGAGYGKYAIKKIKIIGRKGAAWQVIQIGAFTDTYLETYLDRKEAERRAEKLASGPV